MGGVVRAGWARRGRRWCPCVLGRCDIVTEYLENAPVDWIIYCGCECAVMMNIGSRECSVDQDVRGGEDIDYVIARCSPSKGQDHMANGRA